MGHKLHIDQNEKLVIHVLSVDGFSSNIVSHSTMPVKNNLIIYQEVYQSAVLRYGMWDQIRVDHGKEFYLTLFMQEKLADYRNNTGRQPYIQTKSTQVIPNQLAHGGCPKRLPADLLPEATDAADCYHQEVGSSLTRVSLFGRNPFATVEHQTAAEQEFARNYADIAELFERAVHNEPAPFQNGIKDLIEIVRRYV
ncbi:hypothetical protein NQZ68_000881 [Dissostichus eleginoides]|nr:hypothetical protein NQZ68_000881 [Dissostichus eleginoides]